MKIVSFLAVLLYFQFSSLPFSESIRICPKEWKAIDNSCIHVSNITVSKQDAQRKCNKMEGSQLVSIKNRDIDNQIVEILKNVTNGSYAEFYIGLSIKKLDKLFTWTDGTSYNYSSWRYPNITNVTFPSGLNVLCGFYGADLKWLLKDCNTKRRFICQRSFPSRTTPGPSANNSQSSTTPSAPTSRSNSSVNASGSVNSNASSSVNGTPTALPLNATTPTTKRTGPMHNTTTTPKSPKSTTNPTTTENGSASPEIKSKMTIQEILRLVKDIEEEGKKRIDEIKKNGSITEPKIVQIRPNSTDLVAEVAVVPTNGSSSLTFPSGSLVGNIMLPNSVFNLAKNYENNSDAVGITSVFLSGLGKTNGVLNSGVISTKVDVPPGAMDNLTDPVIISLPHGKTLPPDKNSSCAFIDVSNSKWSKTGCYVNSSNSTFTVCHCFHLTSFAILLDVHDTHNDLPEKHKFALLVVSIVGCCIALVCFVAALIVFYLIVSERRRRKTETVAIHKNLAIAEIFALSFFLLAYVAVDSKGVCYAVAFLLHYFLMTVFFWMLIEGINLHRGLVQVFVTSSRIKFYRVFGWVTPLLFVIPTAAVGGMDYVREDFCWMSHQFIWWFAGPVAVITFVNLIILFIAIRVMIKRPRYKMNQIDDSSKSNLEHELRIAFKTTVILLPLLGTTWCLGFLTTQSTTVNIVIQYLFAVTNSLQGMYFFFAHCVYDEDVKKTVSQQIRNCCNRFPVVRATSNTSTRIKSYFSRTLSHSGQSGSGSLSSNSKRTSAFCNGSYDDGRVFEMPSYSSETNKHKISVDSKDSTTDTKASVIDDGNHPNGVTNSPHSPVKDVTKQENTNPVSSVPAIHVRDSAVGFDAYFGGEKPSSEQPENTSVPKGRGNPNQQFFRRARSTIVKLSSTHSFPKRANSLSENIGTRRPLSKQTSSDSSTSGNSNTPILFSGC